MTALISKQEALIYVMVTTSAADAAISDGELKKIADLLRYVPALGDFEPGRLVEVANSCLAMLQSTNGIEGVVDLVASALPKPLQETAYALAVEVAAADIDVRQEELVFLQHLEDAFALPKLAVAAIEHSARVRYRQG